MKLRRTLLWVNGNDVDKIEKAIASNADCIVFDLEDGVPAPLKPEARQITAAALKEKNFRNKERIVRINHLDSPDAELDLAAVLPSLPDAIRLPKCESAEYVQRLDKRLESFERENGWDIGRIEIILMIETALGLVKCFEIATSCKRVTAMGIGMEDMTASLGVQRIYELNSHDLMYARQKLVVCARAAGIQPLDATVLFLGKPEYIEQETLHSARTGFVGRSVFDLTHIDIINRVFSPREEDMIWAKRVKEAYDKGSSAGIAEIRVDGIYIDPPVVAKADTILELVNMIDSRARA